MSSKPTVKITAQHYAARLRAAEGDIDAETAARWINESFQTRNNYYYEFFQYAKEVEKIVQEKLSEFKNAK